MASGWEITGAVPTKPAKATKAGAWDIVAAAPEQAELEAPEGTLSALSTGPSIQPSSAPPVADLEQLSGVMSTLASSVTPTGTSNRSIRMSSEQSLRKALEGMLQENRPTELVGPPVPELRVAPAPALPPSEIDIGSSDATQLIRRLSERTGIKGAGLGSLQELLQTAALPYTVPRGVMGEALDVPYRAIHDLGPGEGGVTPGKVAEFGLDLGTALGAGPISLTKKAQAAASTVALDSKVVNGILSDVLLSAQQGKLSNTALTAIKAMRELGVSKPDLAKKVLPILDRAERISSAKVLSTPEAQAVIAELTKAASRGEAGMVTRSAIEKLSGLGVSSKDIAVKIAPFLGDNALVLGSVGKGSTKISESTRAAIEAVLGHVSVGEKAGIKMPTPGSPYSDWLDAMNPVKKLLDKTVPAEELTARLNPFEALRLLPGSWGKVDSFLAYQPVNVSTLKFEGKALGAILRPVKGNMDAFRAYLTARQALSLEADGFKTGLNLDAAKAVVKDLKNTKIGLAAKEATNYANLSLKTLKDSGIISANTYKAIVKMHPAYAPMYRLAPDLDVVFSESAEKAMKAARKTLEPSNPLQRIKGSTRKIVDPVEGLIKNTYLYVRAADKNMAIGELIKWSKQFPELGKYIKKVASRKTDWEIVSDFEQEALAGGWTQDALRGLKPDGFMPSANTIAHFENGVRTLYEVPADIAGAIKALDRTEINMLWKVLAKPAQLLRAGATLSPEFIGRNPLRDQFSAWIFSKYGYVPGVDWLRGVGHVVSNKLEGDKLYWQWKVAGGEHSMLVSLDRLALQSDIKRALQGIGGLETGSMNYVTALNPVEALRTMSILGEKGTRLGEFARGVGKLGESAGSLRKAAFASREVGLDFARMGAQGRAMNMITAFFNSNLQGPDKLMRTAKADPFGFSMKVGGGITIPSLLLVGSNMQDGRWAEIPSYQKDLFWLILTGHVSKEDWKKMSAQERHRFSSEHPIIRIPKPFEAGIIFGSMPERVFEYMMTKQEEKNPSAVYDWLKNAGEAATPGMMPTAALPIWELGRNRSSFTGARIVPEGQKDMLPAWQSRADTPEFLKSLSQGLGKIVGEERTFSPIAANHIIRAWSGGLGYYVTTITDGLLGKAGIVPDIMKLRPELPLQEQIPLVRGFIAKFPTTASPAVEHFFNEYAKVQSKSTTTKKLAERGVGGYTDIGAVAEEIPARVIYTAMTQALNAANDITVNPMIDPTKKAELIGTIIFSVNMMATEGMAALGKMKAGIAKVPAAQPKYRPSPGTWQITGAQKE